MDHSHLDLSRFTEITAEEYYTTNWKITEDEAKLAIYLDNLPPYIRHHHCIEEILNDKNNCPSSVWNLWACYFRERYIEEYNEQEPEVEAENNNLILTGLNKQLKKVNNDTELTLDFRTELDWSDDDEYILNGDYLNCNFFIFPFKTIFNNIKFDNHVSFYNTIFLGDVDFSSSKFSPNTEIIRTHFYGNANFYGTTTLGWFELGESFFHQKCIFSHTKFVSGALIYKSKFCGTCHFINTSFSDVAIFEDLHFLESVFFKDSKFSEETSFSKCIF